MRKRSQFTQEFKREAVRLLSEDSKPAAELARELGIRRNQLKKWKEAVDQDGNDAFPGSGSRMSVQTEVTEVALFKRELSQAKVVS